MLGKGAHGRIYLAKDLVTTEKVAIKLVSFNNNYKFKRAEVEINESPDLPLVISNGSF